MPEQPSFLPARKGGPPAQPANMTSSPLCRVRLGRRPLRRLRRVSDDRARHVVKVELSKKGGSSAPKFVRSGVHRGAPQAFLEISAIEEYRLADSLRHQPRRSVGPEIQIRLQSLRRQAPIAGGYVKKRLQPLVQRDVAVFHRRAHPAGEFISALAAKEHACLGTPAHPHDLPRAASGAGGSIWPTHFLYEIPGQAFVQENVISTIRHRSLPANNETKLCNRSALGAVFYAGILHNLVVVVNHSGSVNRQ